MKMIKGEELAQILLTRMGSFVNYLEGRELSEDYISGARRVIRELAHFCRTEPESNPWQMRKNYLSRLWEIRSHQLFTYTYLVCHRKLLLNFLKWHMEHGEGKKISKEVLDKYLFTHEGLPPYKKRNLKGHLCFLKEYLNGSAGKDKTISLDNMLKDYFERRRIYLRGGEYGRVITNRSQVVTRRALMWFEREGYLPAGTCYGQVKVTVVGNRRECERLITRLRMKVINMSLPEGLKKPVLDYIEHLVMERKLAESSIMNIVRTNLELCRILKERGVPSFKDLRIKQIDATVSFFMTTSSEDILRRRQRVQSLHSLLRGFLRYLYESGFVKRDLSVVLISPPCYRASRPPQGLSEREVLTLLSSVDRTCSKGRRTYAILMLMATYGLRNVDVARLKLDDIHWRSKMIAISQSKTSTPLTLPMLDDVAEAMYEYIKNDRANYVTHRNVFQSVVWPSKPMEAGGIGNLVKNAMLSAGMERATPRNLRHSVAIHLLRQGERLSTIQDILGHRIPETTQRYAITDPAILRRIIDEEER